MKIAIMQPYFFPYIGYFQLMNAVDKFIFFDDVNYINKGWINRNRILINGQENLFTIPLKNGSQNTKIINIELQVDEKWKTKFLKTIKHAYSKAPYFEIGYSIISQVISIKSKLLIDWHIKSFRLINHYLGIETVLISSCKSYDNQHLKGQHRIIDICKIEWAKQYINPIGAIDLNLYNKSDFKKNHIDLLYIKNDNITYKQFNNTFIENLSMLDLLMFNSKNELKTILKKYTLIEN